VVSIPLALASHRRIGSKKPKQGTKAKGYEAGHLLHPASSLTINSAAAIRTSGCGCRSTTACARTSVAPAVPSQMAALVPILTVSHPAIEKTVSKRKVVMYRCTINLLARLDLIPQRRVLSLLPPCLAAKQESPNHPATSG